MGKPVLIHEPWNRTGFFCWNRRDDVWEKRKAEREKRSPIQKRHAGVKIVCIKRKGDVFCEPAAAWMSERSACLYLCGGDESLF
mgnify:CR=1 FL=1